MTTYTTKDVLPVFERDFGATRRFVVKGDLAFAVLDSGEPMFGFVNFYGGRIRVESCVTLNSGPVPLSVVPPPWFANAANKFIPHLEMRTQRDYWTTLIAASKALGGNYGHIHLAKQHPFAQHTGALTLIVNGKRVEGANRHGDMVGVYTKPGIMHALTSQPGPIISWS